MPAEVAVELDGVVKRFGATIAVGGVSFRVARGALCGLLGPNGSGKTTTLRLIVDLFRPDEGSVSVLGGKPGAHADRVGYLPEERGLYRRMRVSDVLVYYARLKGARPRPAEVRDWLERLGIAEWAEARVEALSKGTAQKAQLIAAVIHEPELVILDEPFTGLDPVSVELVCNAILDLRRRGMTVILSTHDMHVAERLCDSFVMVHKGRKVLDGTLAEIASSYGHRAVKVDALGELPPCPRSLRVIERGSYRELVLGEDADTQKVLERLVAAVRVRRFDVSRPSLHDIFLEIAGE